MSTSAMEGVHSNAYNFPSFINAGVDPRTGTYSCSISFSSLLANALSGPSIPLTLGFNALLGENVGFGTGWTMPFSSYNGKTRKLNLSNGASHLANTSSTEFVIADKKVRDLKTSRQGNDLLIEHKSGILEVLSNSGSNRDEWRVSKIYSAEGRVINLAYGNRAGRRYLSEIRDEQHRLLVVEAGSGSASSSITLWPDSAEKSLKFSLRIQNNELTKITVQPDDNGPASWRLAYSTVDGLRLISQLELPTGGIERLTYKSAALKLPSGAPIQAVPAVSSHTVVPRSNQQTSTREYSYSLRNYLGHGSSAPWRNGGDNLYRAVGNYEYDSTEALILGSGSSKRTVRRTKRTYNRFHLQVSEIVSQNGKLITTRTQYHERPGLTFENQPANFQMPKRSETIFSDTAVPGDVRKEITLTEFDDFGNVLKKTLPSGITEIYEYYPVGVSDGCPADAFGAVRWLKQKTIVPASDRVPAPALISRYRYTQLSSASVERGHFLAVEQESVFHGDQRAPFMTIAREYERNTASPFFGRMTRKTETVQGIASTFDYGYELVDGVLQTHTTLTGKGGVSSRKSSWQHALTGQEVKAVDHLGVVIETTYDRIGRKLVERIAPGTPGQAMKTFSYRLADTLDDPVETSVVGVSGVVTRTRLDGMSRELSVEVQDEDSSGKPMRTVYGAAYDGLGQLVEETETDWLDGKPFALTTTHLYDDWGNRSASIGPDGVVSHDRHDPIRLMQSQWHEGSGRTVTSKNVFGKDDSVERFDRYGKSYGMTRYCLGDPINSSDPTGHFSWKSILSIVIAVAAIALTVVTLGSGTPLTGPLIFAAALDIGANVLSIAGTLAGELAPDSKAGAILGQISLALSVASLSAPSAAKFAAPFKARNAARSQMAGPVSMARQGAVKVSNGQGLKGFSGVAKLGKGARNTVALQNRLEQIQEGFSYVKYVGYAVKGFDVVDRSVLPYFNPAQNQDGGQSATTLDAFLRGGGAQGLQASVDVSIGQFLTVDQARAEAIREV